MEFNNVKVSSRTTHLFGMLKSSTAIGPEAWARMSLCLSIKQKGIPNPDEYNKEGSEFESSKLFAGNKNMFLALMINRLKHDRLDPETYIDEMTRAHINRGAISLKQRINNLTDVYGFMKEMNPGTHSLVDEQ